MPEYEFERLSDGKRVLEWFPMREVPECGAVVKIRGKRHRRLASGQRITAFDPSHVAVGFPRRRDDLPAGERAEFEREHPEVKDYPHVDEDGYAAFSSMREIREFQAKHPRYAYNAR